MTALQTQKKKILFFHHHGRIGGAGISGGQVLASIPQELYDITVCCSTAAGTQMLEYYRDLGFRAIDGGSSPQAYAHFSGSEFPLFSRRSLKALLLILNDRASVSAILEREKPDLVVVNSMTLFWFGSIAKRLGMACVCFFRETYAKEWLGIRNAVIRRHFSKYFDAMALISENDLRENASVQCEKTVICDCVDIERFASIKPSDARLQLGLAEEKKYLLYVGGLSKLKGAHIALAAMLQLSDINASLIFVGADALMGTAQTPRSLQAKLRYLFSLPYLHRCKRMAKELAARDQLVLFPLQQDIAPFYAAADALIAPSTRPHQLRPIYEAGAAEIPVITTRFFEVSEFADDAKAYLAKNGDIGGFSAAAREALLTPDAARIQANLTSILEKNSEAAVSHRCRELFCRLYTRLFLNTEASA